ncbi:SDR family NAD(P)-dependent oxidoreductase [Mycobacterium spongiae]|uniref:Glucose 1-dehydrogenase n=1 Tax=Mycobacterium spongiae TaxID=886343 RepID=A0A975JZ90_9MYCO|nr:SDR family oxidoreductase [Mycobacterium spongiae]QUR68133.1 glucose 1-dehydrogenase [Mycobacterium spongiae]
MSGRLADKIAVISGGGTGIGAATARRFAAEGARVVVTGRRREPIESVAADIGGVAVAGDTSETEHATAAVTAALTHFGGVDIVVANAGVGIGGDVLSVRDEDWQQMLDVNVTGAMKLARAALPALIDRGGGAIVNISSVSALSASPARVGYGVSKSALLALTRSMAYDYGRQGIRVNTVCPGWVRTPMADAAMDSLANAKDIDREEAYRRAAAHLPLRRVARPEEIAHCCVFLASDEASFVTGAVLVADGGGEIVGTGTLAFDD